MTNTEQKALELLEHCKNTTGLPANLPRELSILIRKFFKSSEVSMELSRIMSIKANNSISTPTSGNRVKFVIHKPSDPKPVASVLPLPVVPVDEALDIDKGKEADSSEELFLKLAAAESVEEAFKLFDREYKNLATFIKTQGWDVTANSNEELLSKVMDLCKAKLRDAEH